MSDQNFYERLNLQSDATSQAISKAYRRILMDGNSDLNMHEVEEAYEVLISDEKRIVYDHKLLSRNTSQRDLMGAIGRSLVCKTKVGLRWIIDSHLLIKVILLVPVLIIILNSLGPVTTTNTESRNREKLQISNLQQSPMNNPVPSHQVELKPVPPESTELKSVPEVPVDPPEGKTLLDKLLELSALQLLDGLPDVVPRVDAGELAIPLDADKVKQLTRLLEESLEYFGSTTVDPVERMRAGIVSAMMASGLQDASKVSDIISLISRQNETGITRKQFQRLLERLGLLAGGLHPETLELNPVDQVQRINFMVGLHQLVLANHFSEEAYANFLFPVFAEVELLINGIGELELESQKRIHTDLAEILELYSQSSVNPTLLEFSIDIKELIGMLAQADSDALRSNRNQLEQLWGLVPDLAEANPTHLNLHLLLGWYTGIKKDDWQASQYYFTLDADSPLRNLVLEEQRLSVVDSPYESRQLSEKFLQLSKRFVGAKKQLLRQQAKFWEMK